MGTPLYSRQAHMAHYSFNLNRITFFFLPGEQTDCNRSMESKVEP